MPKYQPNQGAAASGDLDAVLQALSDSTRRRVVELLAQGPKPTSKLASSFEMSLPSFTQHLGVLEKAGLISSTKTGRVRTYSLTPNGLNRLDGWLERQRSLWTTRLDQLDSFLLEEKVAEQTSQSKKLTTTTPVRNPK